MGDGDFNSYFEWHYPYDVTKSGFKYHIGEGITTNEATIHFYYLAIGY